MYLSKQRYCCFFKIQCIYTENCSGVWCIFSVKMINFYKNKVSFWIVLRNKNIVWSQIIKKLKYVNIFEITSPHSITEFPTLGLIFQNIWFNVISLEIRLQTFFSKTCLKLQIWIGCESQKCWTELQLQSRETWNLRRKWITPVPEALILVVWVLGRYSSKATFLSS